MTSPRLGLLVLLAVLAAAGCGPNQSATASSPRTPGPAPAPRVARAVAVTGTLAAEEQIVLSMKVTGRLAELTVDLGSRVRRGDAIARLDSTDFRLRVDQAEAALQQARVRLGLPPDGTDDRVDPEGTALVRQARALLDEARLSRERMARLWEQQLIARAQLDAAVASDKVAEGRYQDVIEEVRSRQAILAQRRSELELARQALADTVLTAPADGVVRERRTAVGEYLAAGTPIATLVRAHRCGWCWPYPSGRRAASGWRSRCASPSRATPPCTPGA
jgi:multidrug resistance efflux pump